MYPLHFLMYNTKTLCLMPKNTGFFTFPVRITSKNCVFSTKHAMFRPVLTAFSAGSGYLRGIPGRRIRARLVIKISASWKKASLLREGCSRWAVRVLGTVSVPLRGTPKGWRNLGRRALGMGNTHKNESQ